jgi:hypothetical protein
VVLDRQDLIPKSAIAIVTVAVNGNTGEVLSVFRTIKQG